MADQLLDDIRKVKQNLGVDWDYEDGYGELRNLVFTALDIADEMREAVLFNRQLHGRKTVYGKDIIEPHKNIIIGQLVRISKSLEG